MFDTENFTKIICDNCLSKNSLIYEYNDKFLCEVCLVDALIKDGLIGDCVNSTNFLLDNNIEDVIAGLIMDGTVNTICVEIDENLQF